jgi:hypothetical protein
MQVYIDNGTLSGCTTGTFNSSTCTNVFAVVFAVSSLDVGVANVPEGFSNRTFFRTAHIRELGFLNSFLSVNKDLHAASL